MAGLARRAGRGRAAARRRPPVVIAGYNGPAQTVVAGPADAVERGRAPAPARPASTATRLHVSHAFHSPLVAAGRRRRSARPGWPSRRSRQLGRPVVSTVTGDVLAAGHRPARRCCAEQIIDPVRFAEAVALAARTPTCSSRSAPAGCSRPGRARSHRTSRPSRWTPTASRWPALLRRASARRTRSAPRCDPRAVRRPADPAAARSDGAFTFFASPCEAAPDARPSAAAPRRRPARRRRRPTAAEPRRRRRSPRWSCCGGWPPSGPSCRWSGRRRQPPARRPAPELDHRRPDRQRGRPAARRARRRSAPTNFATATVGELAEALDELAGTGDGADAAGRRGRRRRRPGSGRSRVDLTCRRRRRAGRAGRPTGHLAGVRAGRPPARRAAAARRWQQAGVGGGVLLPAGRLRGATIWRWRCAARQAALPQPAGSRFVVVQHGRGAAGLAKTLRLEAPAAADHRRADLPPATAAAGGPGRRRGRRDHRLHRGALRRRRRPARCRCCGRCRRRRRGRPAAAGRRRRAAGHRRRQGHHRRVRAGAGRGHAAPRWRCSAGPTRRGRPELAGQPAPDGRGRRRRPLRARRRHRRRRRSGRAVAEVDARRSARSPRVLHGAGRNEPAALASLDRGGVPPRRSRRRSTGCAAVLDAVDPDRLRLLVTFGSIIGRAGLRGEAHYATANDWLTELTERRSARTHPHCRALCAGVVGLVRRRHGRAARRGRGAGPRRHHADPARPGRRRAAPAARRPRRAGRSWWSAAGSTGCRHAPLRASRSCRCCGSSTGRWSTTRASSWSPRPS